jgi:glutamyl-tRNA synthetase
VNAFSIEKVGKSGSKFDPEKTKWFNHQYLIKKADSELAKTFQEQLLKRGIEARLNLVEKIVGLIKERADFVSDFWEQSSFFFEKPVTYDEKMLKKNWKENTPHDLKNLSGILEGISDFNSKNIEEIVKRWLEKEGIGVGQIVAPLRLALVGASRGPHIFDIIEIIGKEETLSRIETAIRIIK